MFRRTIMSRDATQPFSEANGFPYIWGVGEDMELCYSWLLLEDINYAPRIREVLSGNKKGPEYSLANIGPLLRLWANIVKGAQMFNNIPRRLVECQSLAGGIGGIKTKKCRDR